jgi:hypothetical protein
MSKFNITRKNGKDISKEDIETFYLHLSVVCMRLGLYVEDVKKEKAKGTYTAQELQLSKVNPNCEVCDD